VAAFRNTPDVITVSRLQQYVNDSREAHDLWELLVLGCKVDRGTLAFDDCTAAERLRVSGPTCRKFIDRLPVATLMGTWDWQPLVAVIEGRRETVPA
jgi:hypothetical protein